MFARKDGEVEVVEYSELNPSEAAATFDGKSPQSNLMAEGCCSTSLAAACAASAAAVSSICSDTISVGASYVKLQVTLRTAEIFLAAIDVCTLLLLSE